MNQLESKLSDVFEKQAPKLPANARKAIVEWAPWASLVVGVVTVWLAWALWHWASVASSLISYSNALCAAYAGYGCSVANTNQMSLWVWLGVIVLAVEAVLFLLAFFGLRDHKKSGWNYLYWGALVNVVYAVVSLFTGYNSFGTFVGALVGSAIGLWLLFQIRPSYK